MNNEKSINEIIAEVICEICSKYCKYPYEPVPEGKDPDWLIFDPDSPCQSCPLNRLA